MGTSRRCSKLAPLLTDHVISGSVNYPDAAYVSELVSAGLQARKRGAARSANGALAEPLTEAERRVLEKLPHRLTYVDMASELHLSLNTVKTHLRHTYMKLGVDSRSSAVRRATSFGLLYQPVPVASLAVTRPSVHTMSPVGAVVNLTCRVVWPARPGQQSPPGFRPSPRSRAGGSTWPCARTAS